MQIKKSTKEMNEVIEMKKLYYGKSGVVICIDTIWHIEMPLFEELSSACVLLFLLFFTLKLGFLLYIVLKVLCFG